MAIPRSKSHDMNMVDRDGTTDWHRQQQSYAGSQKGNAIAITAQSAAPTSGLQHWHQAVIQLVRSRALEKGLLDHALRDIIRAGAQALGVARVSVWLYQGDRSRSQCLACFDRDNPELTQCSQLDAQRYAQYFHDLDSDSITIAQNVPLSGNATAPREYPENTQAIASILAAPIRNGDSAVGAVCYEQRGRYRKWTASEHSLAEAVADMVALVLDRREHARREAARRRAEEARLAREQRLREFNQILVDLGKSEALRCGDLQAALQEITRMAAQVLAVARVSVWVYNTERDAILCLDLYEADKARHSSAVVLHASDYPRYFQALEQERTIAAHNAHLDARTREFSDAYLEPLGIGAMLDAPIRKDGRMAGVICHEHIGDGRQWSSDEQHFAGSFADCVASAMAASERRRTEDELARRVADLRRSNADLEQFAYVASHDLQEPLRMISTYAELLEQRYSDQLDDRANKYVGYVTEGAQRMHDLINDLLEFSRAGCNHAALCPVDLGAVVRAAIANLDDPIVQSRATIRVGNMPVVHGRRNQLLQVLQNLIGNALKYRSEAPPDITVQAERRDAEWIITVADNGIGIAPQYLERIFKMFQRLHKRGAYEGTGIGLAISKRIVERHHGRIWAESQPDQGSKFFFALPVASSDRSEH